MAVCRLSQTAYLILQRVVVGIEHITKFMQTQIETQTQTSSVMAKIFSKEYGLDFESGQLTGEIVEGYRGD